MKTTLFLSFLLTVLTSVSGQEEGGGFSDSMCKPLPPGSGLLFNSLLTYAKSSPTSARDVRLGWEEEDIDLPKIRVLKDVQFPLSSSKYTSEMDMSTFTQVDVTIMAKIKPVNESGLIFSTHSGSASSNHIGIQLEGSRLYLLFKDVKVDLEVELTAFEWNSFSVEILTPEGDCSQYGSCCISVSTFVRNEPQSKKELCLEVTSQNSNFPTTVTVGKGELYFLTIASSPYLGNTLGVFEGQGCVDELIYGGQHQGSGSAFTLLPTMKGEPGDGGLPFPGPKGNNGRPGAPGSPGQPGTPGPPGRKGFPGVRGNTGRVGNGGNPGAPGQGFLLDEFDVDDQGLILMSSIKGPFVPPKGQIGVRGSSGFTGPRGYPGPSGEAGNLGIQGIQGSFGLPGEKGPKGGKGALIALRLD